MIIDKEIGEVLSPILAIKKNSTIIHKIFETNYSFPVKSLTTGKSSISVFQENFNFSFGKEG